MYGDHLYMFICILLVVLNLGKDVCTSLLIRGKEWETLYYLFLLHSNATKKMLLLNDVHQDFLSQPKNTECPAYLKSVVNCIVVCHTHTLTSLESSKLGILCIWKWDKKLKDAQRNHSFSVLFKSNTTVFCKCKCFVYSNPGINVSDKHYFWSSIKYA